ncbi:unnamed protein product, partial [Didymodactylos carnosus]
ATKRFDYVFDELCVTSDGAIMRNDKIVIPESLYDRVIDIAHDGYQVQHEPCQTSELPSGPWQLIALDFYGPTESGTYLLLIIGEYSRFIIIHEVNTTASHYVLPKLHESLSLFGIPQIVKTDNGPPFNGAEFGNFCNYYGIKHRAITSYWSRANAEAERFMQNLKKVFQNANINQIDWDFELNRFLAAYRATPHSTTGIAPSSLLFKHESCSRLIQLYEKRPFQFNNDDISAKLNDEVNKQKMAKDFDSRHKIKEANFKIADEVLYQPPKHKISNKKNPRRHTEPDKTLGIKGAMITVGRGDIKFTRNSSHFTLFKKRNNLLNNHNRFYCSNPPSTKSSSSNDLPIIPTDSDRTIIPLRRSTRTRKPPDRLQYK